MAEPQKGPDGRVEFRLDDKLTFGNPDGDKPWQEGGLLGKHTLNASKDNPVTIAFDKDGKITADTITGSPEQQKAILALLAVFMEKFKGQGATHADFVQTLQHQKDSDELAKARNVEGLWDGEGNFTAKATQPDKERLYNLLKNEVEYERTHKTWNNSARKESENEMLLERWGKEIGITAGQSQQAGQSQNSQNRPPAAPGNDFGGGGDFGDAYGKPDGQAQAGAHLNISGMNNYKKYTATVTHNDGHKENVTIDSIVIKDGSATITYKDTAGKDQTMKFAMQDVTSDIPLAPRVPGGQQQQSQGPGK